MARLLVSDGTLVKQAGKYKIVINGVVKPILRACAVKDGIVRQYWPTVEPATDQRIVWDTSALTITQSVQDPLDSSATINFNRLHGLYTYNNYPNADGFGAYLSPALDGTTDDDGKYYIKVDQVGGTALTGTLGSWIDLNSAADFVWSLDETVVGTLGATATISIKNAAGTTVVKSVTFASTVATENDISWSTTPYSLVEIKESVDADCTLTFNPSGYAVGDADTSGAFNEPWHVNSPNLGINNITDRFGSVIIDRAGDVIEDRGATGADYTVKATLVSGTAPTGSALATALSLDEVRQWVLLATTGENLTSVLDVEVDTVPTSVPITKRVTINSQRTESITYNNWSTDSWLLTDEEPTGGQVTLTLANDGIATYTNGTVAEDLTEDWHSQAPTPSEPENYEVKLVLISGDSSLMSGSTINTWLSLSTNQVWNATGIAGLLRTFTWDVYVRKIGDIAVIKRVIAQVGTEGSS